MNKLFVLITIIVMIIGCREYNNPPFVVKEIGSEYFNVPNKCTYMSYEYNYVIDECGKYQIGDTIPSVANYIIE